MFAQALLLAAPLLLFASISPANTAARTLVALTLLALGTVPLAGDRAWMAVQALHLSHELVRSLRCSRAAHAPFVTAAAVLSCAYHLQYDYVRVDAFWFLARQHAVAAVVAVLPYTRWKYIVNVLAVATLWATLSWFVWSRAAGVSTLLYAMAVLPHHTFVHLRQLRRAKLA